MINGLEELRKRRQQWIQSSRENNFEDGIKRLLTELYPDNAHFIYELLQNAEDPKATKARFKVTNDAIMFEHNGERLFNLKDVESITSIGASTKRDDPTSIGKFGVGFKAVFAYTSTPEIHSGDFHFRIHDLVVPETKNIQKTNADARQTKFIFPFDHPTKKPAQAVAEIERALRALGDNTLLFLKYIRYIEYLLPDGSSGSLERIDRDNGHIEILSSHPGGKNTVSHWLRFEKNIEIIDEDDTSKTCDIAIAYQLEKISSAKKDNFDWKIVSSERGQVSIFFPAEKETSNLRFHIHAPFASTVARDSVRDCEANNQLRDHIASLVAESLIHIRDNKMLTVDFLSVLPNPMDNLPKFYQPIREAVVHAFQEQPLTPTKDGSHAPASALFKGPAKISRVISDGDLALLTCEQPPLWAANAPQQNQREDRFLDSLNISVWGWSELVNTISCFEGEDEDEEKELIESWIAKKDDTWLRQFYALLGESLEEHYESVYAEDLRLVRVMDNEGHKHVTPCKAFFPLEQQSDLGKDVYFVKPEVYKADRSKRQSEQATSFLKDIGVRTYDEKAVIELKLKHYKNTDVDIGQEHYDDIKRFVLYLEKHPDDSNLFTNIPFILSPDAEGQLYWRYPRNVSIDSPCEETGLSDFVYLHKKYLVWEDYKNKLSASYHNKFVSFLKKLGALSQLEVVRVSTFSNPHSDQLWQDCIKRSAKQTHTGIDLDYSITHLEKYLMAQSLNASRLVWSALIRAGKETAKARFTPNQKYLIRESDSQLVYHLKHHSWIPDITGVFRKPEDMTRDTLPKDFPFDDRNGLLTAIGFGANAKKRSEEYQEKNDAAKNIGFNSFEEADRLAKLMVNNGFTVDDIEQIAALKQSRVVQPEQSVPNPSRRLKGVLDRRDNAPIKENAMRERTLKLGTRAEVEQAKTYLRSMYKNLDGLLVCQCCHAEMPFKVQGEHYFESVQCVRDVDKHYFENRLALCPTCAAMYRHARETKDAEICQAIIDLDIDESVSSAEIMVVLAGKEYQLRFVGKHWFDLKVILSAQ